MEARVEEVVHRLRVPWRTARGELRERRLLVLHLDEAAGEAAPLDGSLEACRVALEAACGVLRSTEDRALALRACAGLPPAAAAVDVAFWNLAAARSGRPLWSLLGAAEPAAFEVNASLGAGDDPASAVRYGTVKVKVGLGDDAARVRAVREAVGPSVRLRVDANGAWSVDEAVARLRELEPFGIELCEEPVHGVEAMRAVRAASPIPVALDETATARNALVPGVADFACLKLAAWGGISPVVAAARRARRAGMGVYLASSLDGPIGIAAAREVAAAIAPDAACGLDTLRLFEA
jgi:L-alanine-DL-glutamate epimerase-like enolase superfamily enzyme